MTEADVVIILYVTPADKPAGQAEAILTARNAKLAASRESRRTRRQRQRIPAWHAGEDGLTMIRSSHTIRSAGETEADAAEKQPARDSRPLLRPRALARRRATARRQVDAGIQPPA